MLSNYHNFGLRYCANAYIRASHSPLAWNAVRECNYRYLCVAGLYPQGTRVSHRLTVPPHLLSAN